MWWFWNCFLLKYTILVLKCYNPMYCIIKNLIYSIFFIVRWIWKIIFKYQSWKILVQYQGLSLKKALLCYNLFWSLLDYQFLSDPFFMCPNPRFILRYMFVVFHWYGNVHARVPVSFLCLVAEGSSHIARSRGLGQRRAGGKKYYAGVGAKLFWLAINCTKPRPDPRSQSSSWSLMGLGRRYLWILW